MSDRIRFELSMPMATRQDGVDYVAYCPALDVRDPPKTSPLAISSKYWSCSWRRAIAAVNSIAY